MHLENLVFDAVDPQRLGRFWEAVLGGERLTDEPVAFETRLTIEGGPVLVLGARHLDIGQRDVPWVVLADPEGNPCCVMEDRTVHADTGPLAALPLDSAEPDRDAQFWSWLTGWTGATARVCQEPAAPAVAALRRPVRQRVLRAPSAVVRNSRRRSVVPRRLDHPVGGR